MLTQKTQMAKRQFRIGDLAKELKVKKFVIRFWEKEFDLKSGRSLGGQRFYTNDDLSIFLTIKDLLYNQGFTIAGAKKQLPEVLAGAKLALDDLFQDLDELSQDFSSHAVQTDDDQDSRDCEFEDEQEGELEQDDEIECKDRLLEECNAGLDQASRGSIKFEVDSGSEAGMTSKVVSDFFSAELAPKPVCAAQACEPLVSVEEIEPVALDYTQVDQEVSVYIQSEQHVAPQEQVISEKIVQEATTVQAAQEICFPARALPDDLFYDGLAVLKEQLLRLHELLD